MGKKGRKKPKHRTAATSDPFDLYERSVQGPKETCEFIEAVFGEHGRPSPRSLREDFCGTGRNAIEWVRRNKTHTAVGYDLDPVVLERAEKHVKKRLKRKMRDRIEFRKGNVVTTRAEPADCVLALNFSFFAFHSRALLKRYFRAARRGLTENGLFVLDLYGGSDSFLEMEEPREVEDFTYVWDQYRYDPISGRATNAIHFRFRDGSAMDCAFVYDWRLWTLPELRDILEEAGFGSVSVYLEGIDDETGEGTGEWILSEKGQPIEGWVANLVAVPK